MTEAALDSLVERCWRGGVLAEMLADPTVGDLILSAAHRRPWFRQWVEELAIQKIERILRAQIALNYKGML